MSSLSLLVRRGSLIVLLLALWLGGLVLAQQSDEETSNVRNSTHLNTGLPEFDQVAKSSLSTPEQALTYFVRQARKGRFEQAAHVLNLTHIAPDKQQAAGAELAQKLYLVMERKLGFSFDLLPDRVDGEVPEAPTSKGTESVTGRRSFLLGTLPLDIGEFEVHLTHFQSDRSGAWLFAPTTVDEIEEAYRLAGPRSWESHIPKWLKLSLGHAPAWGWLMLVASMLVSGLLATAAFKALSRLVPSELVHKTSKVGIVLAATWIPYSLLGFWAPIPNYVRYILLFLGFCALVGILSTTLHYFSLKLIRGDLESVEDLDQESRHREKRTLTYLSVGRRILSFLMFSVGIAIVALQIPNFRTVGLGLLASAGVLGVLLGVAAQPVIGNFIAGVHIGVTRPIRIGDSITYEGTWCYVEDITFMYVMCRTWDEMRLVIPLRYFISNPFKSDSLSDPRAMRTVEMKLDYNVDIAKLRDEYHRLVSESDDWEGDNEPELEVISFNDETVTVRVIAWSRNASTAWRLHCELRERLLEYLQKEQPDALPKKRLVGDLPGKHAVSVGSRNGGRRDG